MKRRLINALAVVSLATAVLLVVAWASTRRRSLSASVAEARRKTDVWVIASVSLNLGQGEVTVTRQRYSDLSPTPWVLGERRWALSRGSGLAEERVLPPNCSYATSPIWNRCGFFQAHVGSFAEASEFGFAAAGVPLWLPTALCLALPSLLLFGRLSRLRRERLGLCVSCGYDVRSTPDRCPECGAVPAETAAR
jgi:hypothetical protein